MGKEEALLSIVPGRAERTIREMDFQKTVSAGVPAREVRSDSFPLTDTTN